MNELYLALKRTPASVFLLVIGVAILVGTVNPQLGGDGDARLKLVNALMAGSDLPPLKYSIVQPLLSIPVAAIGRFYDSSTHNSIRFFNVIAAVILGFFIFRNLESRRGTIFAAEFCLFTLAASMLHVNISFYYGEVLTAFCLVLSVLLVEKNGATSCFLVAIAVANTPAIGPPVLVAALCLRRKALPIVIGLAIAFLIFCAETHIKYGGLIDSGYFSQKEKGLKTFLPYSGIPGFSYPMYLGLLSVVFSFGKGLLFFIPSLILGMKRSYEHLLKPESSLKLCIVVFSVGLLLLYSKWWAWYGGVFWGPRFFLALIFVASLLFVEDLRKPNGIGAKLLLTSLLLLSTWVGMASMAFSEFEISAICEDDSYMFESVCWYVPEFSPLWRPFVELGGRGIYERLTDHRFHSFAIWQVIVSMYFLKKIFSSDLSEDRATLIGADI